MYPISPPACAVPSYGGKARDCGHSAEARRLAPSAKWRQSSTAAIADIRSPAAEPQLRYSGNEAAPPFGAVVTSRLMRNRQGQRDCTIRSVPGFAASSSPSHT